MFKHLFQLTSNSFSTLQQQVREQISTAILEGHVPLGVPLPSTRELAKMLKISRNTVIIAYQDLIADGYLVSRERAGFYVDPNILKNKLRRSESDVLESVSTPDWETFLKIKPSAKRLNKQSNWQQYPYPFIYGQLDPEMFPVSHWRECCLDSVRMQPSRNWSSDHYDSDDSLLIQQIHSRVLPRRGIWAKPENILITVGAQNALFMILNLLLDNSTVFGFEDPGYPDLSHMADFAGSSKRCLDIDERGLLINDQLCGCNLIFTTPSHQFPTTVTMPMERRHALLERAVRDDFLIIEDDYECETNFSSFPTPALKSIDVHDRVIYVGSLSKTLSPGLRLGYIVAPKELIVELREFRRMMIRHPPTNNQRAVGLFLERGYHDSLIRHLLEVYEDRWNTMNVALKELLPGSTTPPVFGGSSYWVQGSQNLNARVLKQEAEKEGVILEAGALYYQCSSPPLNYFRLGYSSIPTERIRPGIEIIAKIIDRLTVERGG